MPIIVPMPTLPSTLPPLALSHLTFIGATRLRLNDSDSRRIFPCTCWHVLRARYCQSTLSLTTPGHRPCLALP